MAVNTTIGHPARGKEYYERPGLTEKLWEKIQSGSSILLTAPRRVGKSSILFYLMDNPRENFRPLYITTESINNENEFFKKLFNLIINTLSGIKHYKALASNLTRELAARIESVGIDGVSIGESRLNYYDELVSLINSLDLKGEHLLLMVDEFAETVQNIIKDEGEREAVHFLQSNRTLRQLPEISEKLQFVFAGSIGLENVVESINASQVINDLYSFGIPPFSAAEASGLIATIMEGSGYTFDEKWLQYLFDKIGWLIPFYIQLMIDEIDKAPFEVEKVISKKEIDYAFWQASNHRNYFSNWHTRLRRAYKGKEYNFTKALLNYVSEHGTVSSAHIKKLASAFQLEDDHRTLLNSLKYDGYINNHDDPKLYRFNSPLLKIWWYKHVAN